jgi:hypothetical protein
MQVFGRTMLIALLLQSMLLLVPADSTAVLASHPLTTQEWYR